MFHGPDHFHEDAVVLVRRYRGTGNMLRPLPGAFDPSGYEDKATMILAATAHATGVCLNDLRAPGRMPKHISFVRMTYYLAANTLLGLPHSRIAAACGRDRTTVLQGIQRVRSSPASQTIVAQVRRLIAKEGGSHAHG